jgi:LemA protein
VNSFLLVFVVALLAAAIWIYNRLVALKNRAESSWSDIDVQLKRRHDLVANLVETVQGYVGHERSTLEEVTRARTNAMNAGASAGPGATASSENVLTAGIKTLFAVAEAYPDLKANESFLDLHHTLVDLEDALQNARRYYNAVVRDLNTRIQSFPDLILARPLGFEEREFFELDRLEEAQAPQVDFGEEE